MIKAEPDAENCKVLNHITVECPREKRKQYSEQREYRLEKHVARGHGFRLVPLDHNTIRRIPITAVFSDDYLFNRVVLKGGNALAISLGLSGRTSMDLDFSIENDFENPAEAGRFAQSALDTEAKIYIAAPSDRTFRISKGPRAKVEVEHDKSKL